MNSIPLISNVPGVIFNMNRGNTSPEVQMRQEINTSLVALKKEAGTLEGLINEASQILDEVNNRIATLENDTVKKSDVVNVIQSGNMNPVTSNAVVPVDEVTSGNMHSVTSNAVAEQLYNLKIKPLSITIQSVTKDQVYFINFTDTNLGNVNVNAFALEFIGGNSAFDYEGCLYCRNTNKQFLYKCGYTQTNLRIYGIVFYTD